MVELIAALCWPLDVSSCEVKNKSSYTSTAPNWPSFHRLTNLPLLPVLLSTSLKILVCSCSVMTVFISLPDYWLASWHREAWTLLSWGGHVQGGSNMTGTDLYVNRPHCAAAVQCGLFTYKSVPVIFEPPCTMDVNTTKWKCIFKTYFRRVSDAPRRHHIWSKPWSRVPLPCTQLWKNKTQHKFSVFRITWLPPPSEPDTGCSTLWHNSNEHIPVIFK